MYAKNFISSTDGNISLKYKEDRILITPSGIHKGFIKPEAFIVVDLNGNKISGARKPSQEVHMHTEVYRRRKDICAVTHAHPPYCIAFTLAGLDLGKTFLPEVVLSIGEIPIVPYTTPTSEEVPQAIGSYIDHHDALILDRHGSLTLGTSLWDAFIKLERMEHVAQVMFLARQLGPVKHLTSGELQKLHHLTS